MLTTMSRALLRARPIAATLVRMPSIPTRCAQRDTLVERADLRSTHPISCSVRWLSKPTRTQNKQWRVSAKKSGKAAKKVDEGVDFELDDDVVIDDNVDFGDDEEWSDDDDLVYNYSREVDASDQAWGKLAWECTNAALDTCKDEIGPIEVYSFRVNPANYRVYIRLDKMEDRYGSPLMDDIILFTRKLNALLEENDAPPEIELEVSSPGAERMVRVPEELTRFKELPMKVCHTVQGEDGKSTDIAQVLRLVSVDMELQQSVWNLADVRANWPGKGRKLSKKKLAAEVLIPIGAITSANLHVDL